MREKGAIPEDLPRLRQYRVRELYDTLRAYQVLHESFSYETFRGFIFDCLLTSVPKKNQRRRFLTPRQVEKIFDEFMLDYR